MDRIACVILGGGKGERLYPLTKDRAKPAVPFGCRYRLVDIPISNSIHAEIKEIFIVTQFNSDSLHTHISSTYHFDSFTRGFVRIMAAKQSFRAETGWFLGTADAVRKNLPSFLASNPEHFMILSGDQLYRMNLKKFLKEHVESKAEISIAATPVNRKTAGSLGILKLDEEGFIDSFIEKPGDEKDISEYKMPEKFIEDSKKSDRKEYLASMGIYIFNTKTMLQSLDSEFSDFGKELIPDAINKYKVKGYVYKGYWEDIGTIRSFYEANLNLASISPYFNLYDEMKPIYGRRTDLPPSKINACTFRNALAGEGSIITDAFISNSLIGIRTIIDSGASLENVYCMGADFYETDEQRIENRSQGIPNIGIGAGTIIGNAIVDKNVRIGRNCRIGIDNIERKDGTYDNYHIRDGLIIINKNACLKDGTSI
ncbi:MAG: glucose-1-phosphate adenylyltransferase [Spirochaetia bacterium]|jgi:glucose-1-phosphate adenylyltransferase|nr:glucose-1-phosphate adenylyltransferase [Spirochaetia bacterium]